MKIADVSSTCWGRKGPWPWHQPASLCSDALHARLPIHSPVTRVCGLLASCSSTLQHSVYFLLILLISLACFSL
jgi:hypothetical protein